MRVVRRVSSLLLAASAVAAVAGCSRSVGVELAVVEPCGQEGLAINSVRSFLLKSSGSTDPLENGAVSFPVGSNAGVAVGLGPAVTMTLAGFGSDITVTPTPLAPTEAPIAIGRTMPLAIAEDTLNVDASILVGRVDSFGGPKSVDGTCAQLSAGGSFVGRHAHTATFVPGVNKVLIVGGAVFNEQDGSETFLDTVELFDPATNTFTALPSLRPPRAYHTATLLPNNKVVIAGGFASINGRPSAVVNAVVVDLAAVDVPYVDFQLAEARAHHTATLLADVNRLILIGGCKGEGCTTTSASGTSTASFTNAVEIIDTTNFTSLRGLPLGLLTTSRAMHEAVGFESGNRGFVVISGGLNGSGALKSIEVLQLGSTGTSPITNIFASNDLLPTPLVRHQMTRDGVQFIITGGQASAPNGVLDDNAAGLDTAIICNTVDVITCNAGLGPMLSPRFGHQAIMLTDQQMLVVGGFVPVGQPTAERFNRGSQVRWQPTSSSGPQVVARQRGALTMMGGAVGKGAVNQVLYTGGYTTLTPYTTKASVDLYFGR